MLGGCVKDVLLELLVLRKSKKSKKETEASQKRSEFDDPKAQAGPNMWKCTWDEEQHAQDTMPLPGALGINCIKTHVSALAVAK